MSSKLVNMSLLLGGAAAAGSSVVLPAASVHAAVVKTHKTHPVVINHVHRTAKKSNTKVQPVHRAKANKVEQKSQQNSANQNIDWGQVKLKLSPKQQKALNEFVQAKSNKFQLKTPTKKQILNQLTHKSPHITSNKTHAAKAKHTKVHKTNVKKGTTKTEQTLNLQQHPTPTVHLSDEWIQQARQQLSEQDTADSATTAQSQTTNNSSTQESQSSAKIAHQGNHTTETVSVRLVHPYLLAVGDLPDSVKGTSNLATTSEIATTPASQATNSTASPNNSNSQENTHTAPSISNKTTNSNNSINLNTNSSLFDDLKQIQLKSSLTLPNANKVKLKDVKIKATKKIPKSTLTTKTTHKHAAKKTSSNKLSSAEQSAKNWIARRESGGSYTARNGNCYGKYQLLTGYLHGNYSPANQERAADRYVHGRYGTWQNAKRFWQAHNWY